MPSNNKFYQLLLHTSDDPNDLEETNKHCVNQQLFFTTDDPNDLGQMNEHYKAYYEYHRDEALYNPLSGYFIALITAIIFGALAVVAGGWLLINGFLLGIIAFTAISLTSQLLSLAFKALTRYFRVNAQKENIFYTHLIEIFTPTFLFSLIIALMMSSFLVYFGLASLGTAIGIGFLTIAVVHGIEFLYFRIGLTIENLQEDPLKPNIFKKHLPNYIFSLLLGPLLALLTFIFTPASPLVITCVALGVSVALVLLNTFGAFLQEYLVKAFGSTKEIETFFSFVNPFIFSLGLMITVGVALSAVGLVTGFKAFLAVKAFVFGYLFLKKIAEILSDQYNPRDLFSDHSIFFPLSGEQKAVMLPEKMIVPSPLKAAFAVGVTIGLIAGPAAFILGLSPIWALAIGVGISATMAILHLALIVKEGFHSDFGIRREIGLGPYMWAGPILNVLVGSGVAAALLFPLAPLVPAIVITTVAFVASFTTCIIPVIHYRLNKKPDADYVADLDLKIQNASPENLYEEPDQKPPSSVLRQITIHCLTIKHPGQNKTRMDEKFREHLSREDPILANLIPEEPTTRRRPQASPLF